MSPAAPSGGVSQLLRALGDHPLVSRLQGHVDSLEHPATFESCPAVVLKSVTLLQLIIADVWDTATLSLAKADLCNPDQVAFLKLRDAVCSGSLLLASRAQHPSFSGRSRAHMGLDCTVAHNLLVTGHPQLRHTVESAEPATVGAPFYRENPPTDSWAARLPKATWSLVRPETLTIRALLGAELRFMAYLAFAQLATASAYDVWDIEDAVKRMHREWGPFADELSTFEAIRQLSPVESNIMVCRNRLYELALCSIDLLRCMTRRMSTTCLPTPAFEAGALLAALQEQVQARSANGLPFIPAVDVEVAVTAHEQAEAEADAEMEGAQEAPTRERREPASNAGTPAGDEPRAGASNAGPALTSRLVGPMSAGTLPSVLRNPLPTPSQPVLQTALDQRPTATPEGGIAGQNSGTKQGPVGQQSTVPIAASAKLSTDAGVRYLAEQLKLPNSAYKMPGIESPQLVWDQWFQKLHGFCDMYATPQKMVIHCLTGHLPANDPVMEGWEEGAQTLLRDCGLIVGIKEFALHVQEKLFSVRCTRADAFGKLTTLLAGADKVTDCKELARQLAQNYSWVFPPDPRGEHAPATKFKVCLLVQQALVKLRTMSGRSKVVQAWSNVTFDQSEVYDKYLRQTLHFVQAESEQLCDSYILHVLHRLRLADEMHSAVHDTPGVPQSGSVHVASDEQTVAYTGAPKRQRKRGRESKDPQRAGAARPETQSGGPSARNPPPAAPKAARAWLMKPDNALKEWNTPAAFNCKALSEAARVNQGMSLTALLERAVHGHCIYCNQKGLHGRYKTCPALKGGDQAAVRQIIDRRRAFRDHVQEHGLESALREERAPPPRELPAELRRHFR